MGLVHNDDNIDIPFCVMHIQQTHIEMHGKLTWCVGVCVGAQIPCNQKHEEVDLGWLGQLRH